MGLPDKHAAVVDERKITNYLLSDSHPAGRAKAGFFRQFGFRLSSWQILRDALLGHASTADVISVTETEFGKKYMLEGMLIAPDARGPRIRSVWFVAAGEAAAQLVSAYPVRGNSK